MYLKSSIGLYYMAGKVGAIAEFHLHLCYPKTIFAGVIDDKLSEAKSTVLGCANSAILPSSLSGRTSPV